MSTAETAEMYGFDPNGVGAGWGVTKHDDPRDDGPRFRQGDLWVCIRASEGEPPIDLRRDNLRVVRAADAGFTYWFYAPIEQAEITGLAA